MCTEDLRGSGMMIRNPDHPKPSPDSASPKEENSNKVAAPLIPSSLSNFNPFSPS